MAIVDPDATPNYPEAEPAPKENEKVIRSDETKSAVVNSDNNPAGSLLTYIEGYPWTVDYYSQILGEDDEPKAPDIDQHAVYQQYKKINALEIRVESPLEENQDSETKEMAVTGTAILYPGIIPNKGDVIIADIGDGREGILVVTDTTRKTIFRDSCFEIEYSLRSFDSKPMRENLDEKVVKELHFRKDFLLYGQSPVLLSSEVNSVDSLREVHRALTEQYMTRFFNHDFRLLLLPGMGEFVYDHYLSKFVLSLYNVGDHPLIQRLRVLNAQNESALEQYTLWDLFARASMDIRPTIVEKMRLVSPGLFNPWPIAGGINHSGVEKVIFPKDQSPIGFSPRYHRVDEQSQAFHPADVEENDGEVEDISLSDIIEEETLDGLSVEGDTPIILPEIHPVSVDDYYVLSEVFYKQLTTGISALELIASRALLGEAFKPSALVKLCENSHKWGAIERYYYTPILIALVNISLRRI